MEKSPKRKTVVRSVIAGLLTLALLLVFCIEFAPRHFQEGTAEATEESMSWMSKIDGSTKLSDISVPGIHDACASNIGLAAFSRCQNQNLADLLNCGYRYIDLRVGMNKDDTFYVCHSFLKCREGSSFFEKAIGLDSVLGDCVRFLNEHSTETLLLVVKYEYGDPDLSEFEKYFSLFLDENVPSDRILYTDSIPTLDEARGKIVLFRRYKDILDLGAKSGIPLLWDDQGNTEISTVPYEYGVNCVVQDRYKYGAEDKWNAFTETADKAASLLTDGAVINFLSTTGSGKVGTPYTFAKTLNRQFTEEYAESGIKGWIILDFGSSELAKVVYQSNWTEISGN